MYSIKLGILYGSNNKAATRGMKLVKTLLIYAATVHDIDASRLDRDQIQGTHIESLRLRNRNEFWDRAFEVHKCVELDRYFKGAKRLPGYRVRHKSIVAVPRTYMDSVACSVSLFLDNLPGLINKYNS